MGVHPEYLNLFAALSSEGIRHCLLRDELESGQFVGDLDLLVDECRGDDALDTLARLGYRVRTTSRYLPYKTVLVKFIDGAYVVIDLHFRIVQNGVVLLNSDAVLDSSALRDACPLPSDIDLLAILVLHNILGKGKIQEKHQPKINRLSDCVDLGEFQQRVAGLSSEKVAEIVTAVVRDLDSYVDSSGVWPSLRDELITAYHRIDGGLRWRLIRRRIMAFWRASSPFPRAPLYALTGVDGAGKSSLNEALLDAFNRPGGFPAVTEYMGPWGHYRLSFVKGELFSPGWSLTTADWLRGMFSKRSGERPGVRISARVIIKMARGQSLSEKEQRVHENIRTNSRVFLTLRYFRSVFAAAKFLMVLMVEMYYRYFIVYKYRRRGVTVITDRYIYDLMTGRMHDMIPNYRRLRAFLCWVFPRPTRVFLLYNNPEVILARKDDLSEVVLRQFIKHYDEQAEKYAFEKVLTNRPPEALANDMIADHFAEIVDKVRT